MRKALMLTIAAVVALTGVEIAMGSGGAGPIATIYNGFTVGSGNLTVLGNGTFGPVSAGSTLKVTSSTSATASLQIENTSSGTAQLRFLGPDGGNNISLPGGKASGLALDSFGVINMTTWVTTTGAERIVDNVPHYGTLSTVAATGTTQANATVVLPAAVWVTVTAADGTKGVQLPSGSAVHAVRLMSQTASALKVYGNNFDDDTINGGAADAAYSQAAGTSILYQTANGTAWFTY